jgi:hypothetical protein
VGFKSTPRILNYQKGEKKMSDAIRVPEIEDLDAFGLADPFISARTEEPAPDWFGEAETLTEKHQTQSLQFNIGDWINEGMALAEKHQTATLQWDMGDWCNRCPLPDDTDGVPKAYDLAESLLGIPRSTLYDWASTAKRIPVSVRTEKLHFTHHRAIANGLPDADDATKKHWVDIAVDEKLSINELKDRLRESRNPDGPKPPTKSIIVKLPRSLYLMLVDIASGQESKAQVVAAEFLTEYLASDETRALADAKRAKAEERTYQRRRRAGIRTALAYDPLGLRPRVFHP